MYAILVILVILLISMLGVKSWEYSRWRSRWYNREPIHRFSTEARRGDFPALIFKTGKLPVNKLPSKITDLYRRIEQENKGWRIQYYDDDQAKQFINQYCCADVRDAYRRLLPGAYKADLFRLCILNEYGGLYSDYSQQYLVPLDDMIDRSRDELVLPFDSPLFETFNNRRIEGVFAAFIAGRRNNTYWKNCIQGIVDHVKTNYYGHTPLDISGPIHLWRVLQNTPNAVYRMDMGKLYQGKNGGYLTRLYDKKRVVKHKLHDHYKLLLPKDATATILPHYNDCWKNKTVYSN